MPNDEVAGLPRLDDALRNAVRTKLCLARNNVAEGMALVTACPKQAGAEDWCAALDGLAERIDQMFVAASR